VVQKRHQHFLQRLQGVKYLNASAPVQSSRFQQPQVTVLAVVTVVVDWPGQNVHFFLYLRVLPCNVRLELVDEVVIVCIKLLARTVVMLPWVMFCEKGQKLFYVVLTVFVVEVDDESDRC
jgi:hypothetical protein